jgi:transposase
VEGEDLICLDEFGINLAMTRTYARAPRGQRAHVTEPFHHGGNISVISALGGHGVCAPMMIEGAINAEVFELYVKHLLVPCLRPGTIVLLDNVKFHYSPKAIALIEAAGACVLYLPAYSPDFNPIEGCIAKLKATLRSFKARTQRKLSNALAKAIALITESDIRGWFEHCGYVFSLN